MGQEYYICTYIDLLKSFLICHKYSSLTSLNLNHPHAHDSCTLYLNVFVQVSGQFPLDTQRPRYETIELPCQTGHITCNVCVGGPVGLTTCPLNYIFHCPAAK